MDHALQFLLQAIGEIKDAILHGSTPRDLDVNLAAVREGQGVPFDKPNIAPITLTNAAQSYQVFPANARRKKFYIDAPLSNTGAIYVRIDGEDATASDLNNVTLQPGDTLDDDEPTTLTSVAAWAVTAGDVLYAQEMNGR
mgnify:CR=1 FL=1